MKSGFEPGPPFLRGRQWDAFFYAPAGHVHGPIEALEDVEFLLWTDGPLDLHLVADGGAEPR